MTNEYHEEVFKSEPFIGLDGHTYHWESKFGNGWSSHSLINDTMVEIEKSRKEAEQKKEEEKEVKVDMSEETRKRLEKLAPMSIIKIGWKAEAETSPYDGSITRVSFCEVVDGYPTKEEALIAFVEEQKGKKYGDNFLPPEGYTNGKERKPVFYSKTFQPTIEERLDLLERYLGISKHKMKQTVATLFVEQDKRLEKIEKRLTEIEGVLTSIGSPEWDLRKKVDGLEKGLAQLADTFYICANNETHNYDDLRKKVEELERKLLSLTGIVRQLDKRSDGAEKALAKDVARNHEETSKRIEDLEKRLRNY